MRTAARLDTAYPLEYAYHLLGDLRALSGVSKFPARVKCALLGWKRVFARLFA